MKTGIPLPVIAASAAPAHLHAVPPPPRSRSSLTSQAPTMRLEDPLKTEQMLDGATATTDSGFEQELRWSRHAEKDDEALDEDALLALADLDWEPGSRVKRQARRLLELARKIRRAG